MEHGPEFRGVSDGLALGNVVMSRASAQMLHPPKEGMKRHFLIQTSLSHRSTTEEGDTISGRPWCVTQDCSESRKSSSVQTRAKMGKSWDGGTGRLDSGERGLKGRGCGANQQKSCTGASSAPGSRLFSRVFVQVVRWVRSWRRVR